VTLPEDKKVLNYSNIIQKTADHKKRKFAEDFVTFDEVLLDMLNNEDWAIDYSVKRMKKEAVVANFNQRIGTRLTSVDDFFM